MRKIILPDIFGVTNALLELCGALQGDIEVVNPYSETMLDFASELDAYNYFNETSSLSSYNRKLSYHLCEIEEPISLLGFSMGGSAIWRLTEDASLNGRASALCYYPGQVRHHTHITPDFPITLVMAKEEQHFSVEELATTLSTKQHTTVKTSHELHGFMNRQSTNFSQTAYSAHIKALTQLAPEQNFTDAKLPDIEKP